MRRNNMLVFAFLAAISLNMSAVAQNEKKKVEGSGNIVTREVAVSSFEELEASGIFNLYLSQGNKEALKIEADDNFQELFEVKNEGSKLIIRMKKDVNIQTKNTNKLKVYLTFKKLKSMDLSMVGGTSSDEKLSFDNLKLTNQSVGSVNLEMSAQTFEMENESVGNVKLTGSANNAVIKNEGVGALHAGEFVVQKMDIENSGVGSAEVNATKELKVNDTFLGKVKNKGAASVKRTGKVVI